MLVYQRVFTYKSAKCTVGKYTSPMDAMGMISYGFSRHPVFVNLPKIFGRQGVILRMGMAAVG